MKFFGICVILILAIFAECKSIEENEEKQQIDRNQLVKPDVGYIWGITDAILAGLITAGATLFGTTVGALQKPDFVVAVSGSIENYSKWPLHFKESEIKSGYMNVPMQTVLQGMREGFASHKQGHTTTGSWVRGAFTINNVMIHVMYSAPYNFDFYSNWLAIAVCPANDRTCKSFTADNLYYDNHSYIERREYYYSTKTLRHCSNGICVFGTMGTDHHPIVSLKVMPQSYHDLCDVAKNASVKGRWSESDYDRFLKNQ